MTREARFSLAATLLIAAAALLVLRVTAPAAAVPPRLDAIPLDLGGWSAGTSSPPAMLAADRRAAQHLGRSYEAQGGVVWVAVDHYPQQDEQHRPAARDLVFPSQGWAELREQRVVIRLEAPARGELTANLVVARTGDSTVATLYWYEVAGRSLASDHGYRALAVWNRLAHGRREGTLVRVAVTVARTATAADALATMTPFVRAFHPALVAALAGP